jgi:hypothetical protein
MLAARLVSHDNEDIVQGVITMGKQEHITLLQQGITDWNRWRILHPDTFPDLIDVDPSHAYFIYTNLNDADLSNAVIGFTTFGNVDLQSVKGLRTVEHHGPSTVGTNTIVRSGGVIPESFLRGTGMPKTFITYTHSLINNSIKYYTCFISYSSKDTVFAQILDLRFNQRGQRSKQNLTKQASCAILEA